ncbi:MAG: formate/nitrite transporter family protein [Clostridiaceae bacterium]|jgi:formate/nitrite transporter|nr:formate/nitrite transporter family protein [Clostridiaceae bacterium]
MGTASGSKILTDYILDQSKNKAGKRLIVLIVKGILAGIYIAIGAIASLKLSANVASPGLGDFLGAAVFPLGIIAVLILQAELFTSDCMVMTAVYARQSKILKTFKFLLLILISNLAGGIFMAFLTRTSGIFNEATAQLVIEKAIHKVNMPFGTLLSSAILCNIIVCTGICLAYTCKDEIAKIAVLWLSIAVFVLSGTEHVVANMFYLFAGLFFGGAVPAAGILYNLGIAAIGNFIGGGIIVAGLNYLLARKDVARN